METQNNIVNRLLEDFNENLILKNDIDSHAEVFDKHPITAMSEAESGEEAVVKALLITDSWRPEWCRDGVQVPLNKAEEQKIPHVKQCDYFLKIQRDFRMPDKLIRSTNKHYFDFDKHIRVKEHRQLLYEIDPLDVSWIQVSNTERQCLGLQLINEHMIEVIFEMLESLCYKRIRTKIREAETAFLEHDENSKCDVCQSPEGEDGNELVFCEDCFICVHQACYGIPELPAGSWICRHCDKCPNISTPCVLCPNRGGAMKQIDTEDEKWAHLSCAVWIPEVGFGDIDLMEPITRYNSIPQARWGLKCHLCKISGTGAPIQCSERKCKLAFHVTCAIKNNLLMKQEFHVNNDVKLLAYCKIHSKKYMEQNSSEDNMVQGPRDIIELRIQKDDNLRQKELEQVFHTFATISDLKNPEVEYSRHLLTSLKTIPSDIKEKIYTYWKLKRTSNHFLCLIKPPSIWSEEHLQQRFNNRSVMGAFCKIRYGLDRARLVVDMMIRREKKKAQLFEVMSRISQLQLHQLKSSRANPLLKDDPSLAANWGMISTVHLDDSVYINPGNLMDPNFEVVVNNISLTKRLDKGQKGNDFIESMKQRAISSKCEINEIGKFDTKISVQKLKVEEVSMSCVFNIPRAQLIVKEDVKRRVLEQIQQHSFRNHFMLPVISHLKIIENNDLCQFNSFSTENIDSIYGKRRNISNVDSENSFKHQESNDQRNVFEQFQSKL